MNSSVSGKKYELDVFQIVKNCTLNGVKFNSQNENELGGSSARNDIECNMTRERDVCIEIKKANTPDWMQCSLHYDKKWSGGSKNKIPNESKQIFEDILSNVVLFNGKIPPFLTKKITHDEWLAIKNDANDYNDVYIDCPLNTIQRLYSHKQCAYIQISNKGLYHLGNDICQFNVPPFVCEQQLRIRTKIHTRKNKQGFCNLSVTVACQPKNIHNLIASEYSLDDRNRLPNNLIYCLDTMIISDDALDAFIP
jgi:hypothetical protein